MSDQEEYVVRIYVSPVEAETVVHGEAGILASDGVPETCWSNEAAGRPAVFNLVIASEAEQSRSESFVD
jgi:hypothetical protein